LTEWKKTEFDPKAKVAREKLYKQFLDLTTEQDHKCGFIESKPKK
jgi:hypothetical protein